MPEGHTIHRLAADHEAVFGGRSVRTSSPQGKFADGAALIDGQAMTGADAHGKHLFLGFLGLRDSGGSGWVHVHLGLYGKFGFGTGPAPAPVGQVRLRIATPDAYADLRGPTRCALITDDEKQAVHDRLGPDPLRNPAGPDGPDGAAHGSGGYGSDGHGSDGHGSDGTADPERAWARISRSRTTIAALLMDQKIVAGVGNVYRAEVLFRQGIDPYRAGRDIRRAEWDAIWADLVGLMHEGVRHNRIDTVRPEHTPEAMGRAPRVDDHGGEVYVYRRAHQPCHLCGSEIRTAGLAARNLFWCPGCQRR